MIESRYQPRTGADSARRPSNRWSLARTVASEREAETESDRAERTVPEGWAVDIESFEGAYLNRIETKVVESQVGWIETNNSDAKNNRIPEIEQTKTF